jgi:hypothetical protein
MPSPRKAPGPADSSDHRELENLLRSAANFFRTNQPKLIRQPSEKKASTAPYSEERRRD